MLTDIQISALESTAETFGGISDLERACRQYRREMAALNADAWKINLANLERLNPAAYAKVLSTIPSDKASELTTFIAQYKGKPLPEVQRITTLSEAKAIASAKGGGTIVKP